MSEGYIKFNDLLTAVGNMLKEMGSKEVTIQTEEYDLSGFCDKLYESAYAKGKHDGIASHGCDGCINYGLDPYGIPCSCCARLKVDYYKSEKGDSNG